jgi:excisionase family DNA binding protein
MSKNKAVVSKNKELFFDNKIMRVEQVADMMSFSKWHIYRLVNQNKIPYYKKGKTLFFMSAEIFEWVKEKDAS